MVFYVLLWWSGLPVCPFSLFNAYDKIHCFKGKKKKTISKDKIQNLLCWAKTSYKTVKTSAAWYRFKKSEGTQRQRSNLRGDCGEEGRARSLCFSTQYFPQTSFSLFQLSPPKTELCGQEGGARLRPWMSPAGPVSLDKQWISATAALLCLRDWDLLCQVEQAPAVLLLLRTEDASFTSMKWARLERTWLGGFIAGTFSTSQMVLWYNQTYHHQRHTVAPTVYAHCLSHSTQEEIHRDLIAWDACANTPYTHFASLILILKLLSMPKYSSSAL